MYDVVAVEDECRPLRCRVQSHLKLKAQHEKTGLLVEYLRALYGVNEKRSYRRNCRSREGRWSMRCILCRSGSLPCYQSSRLLPGLDIVKLLSCMMSLSRIPILWVAAFASRESRWSDGRVSIECSVHDARPIDEAKERGGYRVPWLCLWMTLAYRRTCVIMCTGPSVGLAVTCYLRRY